MKIWATAFLLVPNAALADLTLIVEREKKSVAIFAMLAAGDAAAIFGAEPNPIARGDVDTTAFAGGTWNLADELGRRVAFHLDGRPAPFEGVSLMVHPTAEPVAFATPFDASLAVSVCGAVGGEPTEVDMLDLYAAWNAYPVDGTGMIELRLPRTGRDSIEVTAITYMDGVHVATDISMVDDGGTISLNPAADGWRYILQALGLS